MQAQVFEPKQQHQQISGTHHEAGPSARKNDLCRSTAVQADVQWVCIFRHQWLCALLAYVQNCNGTSQGGSRLG